MKRNKYIILILTIALMSNSCGDKFFDVNDSPNNPVAVPPEVVLPVVLTAASFLNNNELNRFGSTIAAYTAGAGNAPRAYDQYTLNSGSLNNQWNGELYGGVITESEQLILIGGELGASHYVGIGKIMQAYGFAIATDVWGDVPYSQSPSTTINRPEFDAQQDIYEGNAALEIQSLFDLVREGIADLESESSVSPGAEDIIYGGDIDAWIRAGYTMMLKLANTVSVVNPALATSVINEVLATNTFIDSNAEDMNATYGAVIGSQTPAHTWTNISTFQDDMIMSSRFENLLVGNNDPRLPIFFTQGDDGNGFTSIENGDNLTTLPEVTSDFSQYNTYVTGVAGEGPIRMLTNFQVQFILAESALNLPGVTTPSSAQEHYTAGITASMMLAGIEAADITAYLAANPTIAILDADPNAAFEQIMTQKYIAWCGNGLEAWNDWRRTGFPTLLNVESVNAQGIDGTRPVRLNYTNDEINNNPNAPAVVNTNVKVWWDAN